MIAQPVKLVIHGGAGTIHRSSLYDYLEQKYRKKLSDVFTDGCEMLEKGDTNMKDVKAAMVNIYLWNRSL